MEFMDRRNRSLLVQFWLTVESFKNPLESEDATLWEPYEGSDVKEEQLPSAIQEDVIMLYESYLSQDVIPPPLSIISANSVDSIRSFVLDETKRTIASQSKARRAAFMAQRQVEQEMEQDFTDFQKSDLWFRAVQDIAGIFHPPQDQPLPRPLAIASSHSDYTQTASERRASAPRGSLDSPRSVDPPQDHDARPSSPRSPRSASNLSLLMELDQSLAASSTSRSPLFGDTQATSVPSGDIEHHEQILAMQDALGDIIGDQSYQNARLLSQDATSERRPMFPDDEDETPRVLDDIHDEMMSTSFQELDTGGPGVGAGDVIGMMLQLEKKIERLISQELMLNTLIRKAELSGDNRKYLLLTKSKASMDQELSELKFQMEQFAHQQAENNLAPGRTKVEIVSSAVDETEEKSVVRYLIEVKQMGADGTHVSGWMVARRYNEFLSLHQKLRDSYAAVRTLEFPGKRLVTSLSPAFVEARRNALEKYLQVRVLLDLAISSSDRCHRT